mmetsp:Transcript_11457/g.16914  ORF Transcript_11457/g.16914 Transcript_11457/m.16914 type:complete len:206 (+) Transcript_11457:1143-1760(+)
MGSGESGAMGERMAPRRPWDTGCPWDTERRGTMWLGTPGPLLSFMGEFGAVRSDSTESERLALLIPPMKCSHSSQMGSLCPMGLFSLIHIRAAFTWRVPKESTTLLTREVVNSDLEEQLLYTLPLLLLAAAFSSFSCCLCSTSSRCWFVSWVNWLMLCTRRAWPQSLAMESDSSRCIKACSKAAPASRRKPFWVNTVACRCVTRA